MNAPAVLWHDYDYALIRVVPRVQLGTFVNVGVILHARTARYLGIRVHLDAAHLAALCPPTVDVDLVARHLAAYEQVCAGGVEAGPLGLLTPSERFHWLTAPRSAVLQTSPLHVGRTTDPAATLDHLLPRCVLPGTAV